MYNRHQLAKIGKKIFTQTPEQQRQWGLLPTTTAPQQQQPDKYRFLKFSGIRKLV